jgi:CheY-like chemotaxis protein
VTPCPRTSLSSVPLHGARILLVEDHEDTRLAAEACLTADGGSVTVASSAEQALAELSNGQFDVVITDYIMPQNNGRWLLDRIQDQPNPPPVILLTGHPHVEDMRAPFARIFRKPVDYDKLCEELLSIVRTQR